MPGVYRTRVGYTGGSKEFPTYHDLGDHTEALQIDFDPLQIPYSKIVELFWNSHNPLQGIRHRQYQMAIWYHDQAQADTINHAKEGIERKLESDVCTPIRELDVFYLAEDYHQKYRLQNSPLMPHFVENYPNFEDFNNSTAAARLNGFLAGFGSAELLSKEINTYGIPIDELRKFIRVDGIGSSLPGCSTL